MRSGLFLPMMLAASNLAAAETPLTIDQLLAQGWEIAGYASGYDNRTSLILFRHPGVNARTMELGIGADADVGFAWSGRRRWCRRRSRAGSYRVIGNDRQIA
jgi:hypothetical protein